MRRFPVRLLVLSACLAAVLATAVPAAEPAILYPAKVMTMDGRIFEIENLGHELESGSFVFYDGETEGRVPWRDLDRVVFVERLGHEPDALGPKQGGTRRVRLEYVTGETRVVNLVVGDVHGFDGIAKQQLRPRNLAVIDFDQAKIAPKLYKACERGHVWEQTDYRYCPWDGLALDEYRL